MGAPWPSRRPRSSRGGAGSTVGSGAVSARHARCSAAACRRRWPAWARAWARVPALTTPATAPARLLSRRLTCLVWGCTVRAAAPPAARACRRLRPRLASGLRRRASGDQPRGLMPGLGSRRAPPAAPMGGPAPGAAPVAAAPVAAAAAVGLAGGRWRALRRRRPVQPRLWRQRRVCSWAPGSPAARWAFPARPPAAARHPPAGPSARTGAWCAYPGAAAGAAAGAAGVRPTPRASRRGAGPGRGPARAPPLPRWCARGR